MCVREVFGVCSGCVRSCVRGVFGVCLGCVREVNCERLCSGPVRGLFRVCSGRVFGSCVQGVCCHARMPHIIYKIKICDININCLILPNSNLPGRGVCCLLGSDRRRLEPAGPPLHC